MARTVLIRLGQVFIVLVLVTMGTAALVSLLPGDPAEVIIPSGTEEARDQLREELGLDEPFYRQYLSWLGDFVQGDMGNYYRLSDTAPVAEQVKVAAPVSLLLIFYVQVVSLGLAVPFAVVSAQRAGSRFDKASNTAAFALLSIPGYVLGAVLSYYVGVELCLSSAETANHRPRRPSLTPRRS